MNNQGRWLTLCIIFCWTNTAFAGEWFVRPAGSPYGDSSGSSYQHAWAGFAEIVWSSIKPGDTIYICGIHDTPLGIKASGSHGALIHIRGDCAGEAGEINPVDLIPAKWVLDGSEGTGVYKQALGYDPWTIVLFDKRIGRIHSSFMESGGKGWAWLAQPPDAEETTDYGKIKIKFWEPVKAIFGYKDGMTYIRFGDQTNPNHLKLFGRKNLAAVNFNGSDYVRLTKLRISGASTGMSLSHSSDFNTIEHCTILGCNDGILIYDGCRNNRIEQNTLNGAYYGADDQEDWGAWDGGITYQDGIREQIREWFRHRFMNEFQDIGIRLANTGDGNFIEKNNISEKYSALVLNENKQTNVPVIIRENIIRNIGYLGLLVEYGWVAEIQANDFRNCNITYRFQQLMNFADRDRNLTIRLNNSYLPTGVGNHIFWHTFDIGDGHTLPPTIRFEDNLFVGGNKLMQIGLPEIVSRKMLSDTSFVDNRFACPTKDGYFNQENWKRVEGNRFYRHEDDDLPDKVWMQNNYLMPDTVSEPTNIDTY